MTTTINHRMGLLSWSQLVLMSLIWGGSFLLIKITVQEIPPATMTAGRLMVAATAVALVAVLSGTVWPRDRRLWLGLVLLGALNSTIPLCLASWGQQYIEVGLAGILNAATPLFAVILTPLLIGEERFTVMRLTGILSGIAGVAILFGPSALSGAGTEVLGSLAVLGASLCYALAAIAGRRFSGQSLLVLTTGQLAGAALWSVPLALWLDRPWTLSPGVASIASILAQGLVCSAFAYLLYFMLLKSAGATNTTLVTLLAPVSATLLGMVVLGERPGPEMAISFGLVAIGLVLVDGRMYAAILGRNSA